LNRTLVEQSFLILDLQTTGMQPSSGKILEIGWSLFSSQKESKVHSSLIRLGDGEKVSERIQEITGIRDHDLTLAKSEEEVWQELQSAVSMLGPKPIAVIHYAQFERAFLIDWSKRRGEDINFEILCSQRIARKLFPGLPSQNMRGMTGYFGSKIGDFKRARDHVMATIEIWRAIIDKLAEIDIHDVETLQFWLQDRKTKPKPKAYQYRLDRLQRLALPNKPGIYRMLAKDGRILYVGKATSLKSRVNSYFRGQKNRDRRKLEMLAQVWDLDVTECETPLEAALLETDEIKKWNPPYNISLKAGSRRLVFYSRDFENQSLTQDHKHPLGPYRAMGIIENLRLLWIWCKTGALGSIFYQEIDAELMAQGLKMFCVNNRLDTLAFPGQNLRQFLALGVRLLRQYKKCHPGRDLEELFAEQKVEKAQIQTTEKEVEVVTVEDIAAKFERLFIRSALATARSKELTAMLNAKILIETEGGVRELPIRGGHLNGKPATSQFPWDRATIADYDRMSILLSEVQKQGYKVTSL
jgi:DNA polymerase-3 subunit epsilon